LTKQLCRLFWPLSHGRPRSSCVWVSSRRQYPLGVDFLTRPPLKFPLLTPSWPSVLFIFSSPSFFFFDLRFRRPARRVAGCYFAVSKVFFFPLSVHRFLRMIPSTKLRGPFRLAGFVFSRVKPARSRTPPPLVYLNSLRCDGHFFLLIPSAPGDGANESCFPPCPPLIHVPVVLFSHIVHCCSFDGFYL